MVNRMVTLSAATALFFFVFSLKTSGECREPKHYLDPEIEQMSKRIEADPHDPALYVERARLRNMRCSELDWFGFPACSKDVISDYGEAIALRPDYYEAYVSRADLYLVLGNYFLFSDDSVKRGQHRILYGECITFKGHFLNAVADYKKALEISPDRGKADGLAEKVAKLERLIRILGRAVDAYPEDWSSSIDWTVFDDKP